jgi:hypothetical protein
MYRTATRKSVAIATAALALVTGAVIAGSESAAPGSTGGTSARAHDGWPVSSDLSTSQAVGKARAAAREDGGTFLRFVEVSTRFQFVDVGAPDQSPGDYLLFESGIYTPRGDRVGRDSVRCVNGIRTFACDGTVQLFGRGKIVVSGAFFGDDTQIAITGGTREFRNAGGQLFAVDQPDGTTDLVFQLTG